MESKEYIKNLLAEQYPNLDVRDGSPLSQFLITPADYLASYFFYVIDYFINNHSVANYATISESFLDIIAANFFVERSDGEYSRGYVRVYFNSPTELDLAVNEVSFEDVNENTYSLYEAFYISESAMSRNITSDGMYYYADMYVIADEAGSASRIEAHQMTQVASGIDEYVKVDNIDAFEGGADADTNEDLYNKIAASISPRDILINQNSIEYKLMNDFPEIKSVLSLGFEDFEMLRDRIWDIATPADKNYYILSYMDNKRFTNNKLEYNNMVTLETIEGGSEPSGTYYGIDQEYGPDIEIDDGGYVKTRASDGNSFSVTVGLFIDEQFDILNTEFYEDWFTIESGYSYPDVGSILEDKKARDYIYIDETEEWLVFKDNETVAPLAIYNTTLLTEQRTNIRIEGKFKTGPIESNERSTTNYIALTNNPYYSESLGKYWCSHFAGYGLAWHTCSNSSDPTINDIYIVDHNGIEMNIVAGPIIVDHAQHIMYDNNGNEVWQKPYLAAGHAGIETETWYNFQIDIFEDYKIQVTVWKSSETQPGSFNIEYGGGDKLLDFLSTHVKLMVSVDYAPETHGESYYYYYDYIRVRSFKPEGIVLKTTFTLPKLLDTTYKEGQFLIYVNGTVYPWGSDPPPPPWDNTFRQFEIHYKSGITDMVEPFSTSEISWDNTNKIFTLTKQNPWKYDDVVTGGPIDVSQFSLWVYYQPRLEVDRLNPLYLDCLEFETIMEGIHAGGYIDAFCHTPEPSEATVIAIASDAAGRIDISIANGFTLPFYQITSIVTNVGQTPLVEGTDYTVYNGTDTLRYSYREDGYIMITNATYKQVDLDIICTHFSNYSDYQTLGDSILSRELCSDVLIKEYYPAEVSIDIGLAGTFDADTLKQAICDYINNLEVTSVSATELEDIAQENGALIANIIDLSCIVQLPDRNVSIDWDSALATLTISIADTAHYYTAQCCRFLCKKEDIEIV